MVQTNVGHTDAVRSIIHIPERKQVGQESQKSELSVNTYMEDFHFELVKLT